MRNRTWLALSLVLAEGFAARPLAQEVEFIRPPVGYRVDRLPLGAGNSADVLAPDPADENFIYAAGAFNGVSRIVHLNLRDGRWTAVLDAPATVSVNGLAVLSADVMFVSDNRNDHLYVLVDNNPGDGDFNDPGEIRDLIEPILTDPTWGWTGSAVAIVKSGDNRLGLPAGTVLFQSEDGHTTEGEVLAVIDPLTSPVYQPAGGAYFSGFNYGGGLAIDSNGRLIVASSFWPETGKIWVCEDLSGNGVIEPGESNIIVPRASETTEWAGLSSLAVDGGNRCYCTVGWGGFGSPAATEIRTFVVPDDALNTTASVRTFATLRSPFVNAVILNTTSKSFQPFADNGAVMVISASDEFFGFPDYLLTVAPFRSLGAKKWDYY